MEMRRGTLGDEKRHQMMDNIFHPKSVAVIGASSDSEKEKNSGWVGRLVQFGYKGKIYPINPKGGEILGLKAYPSIGEVPDPIDYVIIAIPRHLVPGSLKGCVAKGVKVTHIYTAGFSEVGAEEGPKLQRELEEIIRTGNSRVIGPNCMGIYCPSGGLSFDIRFPKESGSITFISQTGVGGRRLIHLATGRGLRFSKAVSYGNAIDLNVVDFLEYASSDPETKLILLYLEGLLDGRRFFNLLRECQKPVVLVKAGLSESGQGAVASHTASLAGSRQVWDALFKQTGAIPVETLEEAVEQMIALQTLPPIQGRRVGLVGRGGGIGVVATDLCEREGLKVPQLGQETRNQLAKITPADAGSSIRNPVEIGLGITGVAEHYVKGLQIIAADPQVDFLITFLNPEDYLHYGVKGWAEDIRKGLVEAKKMLAKPLAVVFLQGQDVEVFQSVNQIQRDCLKEGIGCFPSLDVAIRAVTKLITYYQNKNDRSLSGLTVEDHRFGRRRDVAPHEHQARFLHEAPEEVGPLSGKEIIQRVRGEGRILLTELESKELMRDAGIPVNDTKLAQSRDEAISISNQLGYPVVLKIASHEITHKSDAGGVKLEVKTPEEVGEAYDEMLSAIRQKFPKAVIQGITVQKEVSSGIEVIVGMFKDAQFGPVIMFGLGGILVEILKDISFRIVPLTKRDAASMIKEIKGYPLLGGYRGQGRVDIRGLEKVLLGLSVFIQQYPEIRELDLNPIFAYSDGNLAVDARIVLETGS
jgi:acetyltransferase